MPDLLGECIAQGPQDFDILRVLHFLRVGKIMYNAKLYQNIIFRVLHNIVYTPVS